MTTVGTPDASAFCRPGASARLEITTAISAGKSSADAALISAAMFEPRPEIRIATRRFMPLPCEVEVSVVDHAMVAPGRDHLAQQGDALAAASQNLGDGLDRVGLHDRDHADAAIEGAQKFELGNAALL